MSVKILLFAAALLFACQGLAVGQANQRPRISVKISADREALDDLLEKRYHSDFLDITRKDVEQRLAYYFPCMEWSSTGTSDAHAEMTVVIHRTSSAYGLRTAFTLEYKLALPNQKPSLLSPHHTIFRESPAASQAPSETQYPRDQPPAPSLPPSAPPALVQLQKEVHITVLRQFLEQPFRQEMDEKLGQLPIANSVHFSEGGKGGAVTIAVDGRKMRLRPLSALLHIRVDTTSASPVCANQPYPCFIEVQATGSSSRDELLGVFRSIPCCNQRWPPDLNSALAGRKLDVYLDPSHLHCDPDDPCMPPRGAEN